jgi:hypothetical protein
MSTGFDFDEIDHNQADESFGNVLDGFDMEQTCLIRLKTQREKVLSQIISALTPDVTVQVKLASALKIIQQEQRNGEGNLKVRGISRNHPKIRRTKKII